MPSWIRLGGDPGEPANYPHHAFPWGQDWLELAPDLSEADWIVQGIHRRINQKNRNLNSGNYIPDGFNAYARLLHPAYRLNDAGENAPLRWAEIAARNGRTVHPWMDFRRIANIANWNRGYEQWENAPREGRLPPQECQILTPLMQEFTQSPDLHYFCFWEGYGQGEFFPALSNRPKVSIDIGIDLRNHFLFRGRLDPGIIDQAFQSHSPNIWWPADRAWCIITDIDAMETWIGASKTCINRILNHPQLEAHPTTINALWNHPQDTINPPPNGA